MESFVEEIKKAYAKLMEKNLAIFKFPTNHLWDYKTTKNDVLWQISRMPERKYRIKDERVIIESESGDEEEVKGINDENINENALVQKESKWINCESSALLFVWPKLAD